MDKREYQKRWRENNKEKVIEYRKKYYTNNYDKLVEYRENYHKNPKNYETIKAGRHRYFQKRNLKDYFRNKVLPHIRLQF